MNEVFNVVFNENSQFWNRDPEYNRVFLQCQQNYFNHLLQARGHVFLNEIFDALGIQRIPQGQICGWINKDKEIRFGMDVTETGAVAIAFITDGVVYENI